MKNIILLFISVLPVYIILAYVYNKDKEKESRKLLSTLFLKGIASCFPVIILELCFSLLFPPENEMNTFTLFWYTFLGIALIEEGYKWFITYKISYNSHEFNQVYDGIVYAVFVSLGFACFENILYVFESGISTGILRMFLAVPGHACDAIVMGNYFSLAKISAISNDKNREKKNLVLSILIPTLTHTIYDFCLFTGESIFLIIFSILVISIYIYSYQKIKHFSKITTTFNNY